MRFSNLTVRVLDRHVRDVMIHKLPVDHEQSRELQTQPLTGSGCGCGDEPCRWQLITRSADAREESAVRVRVGEDALERGAELKWGGGIYSITLFRMNLIFLCYF